MFSKALFQLDSAKHGKKDLFFCNMDNLLCYPFVAADIKDYSNVQCVLYFFLLRQQKCVLWFLFIFLYQDQYLFILFFKG